MTLKRDYKQATDEQLGRLDKIRNHELWFTGIVKTYPRFKGWRVTAPQGNDNPEVQL